jgi:hypothetical protein
MKSGLTGEATAAGAHAATCNVSGGRIGSPRTKVWMTIIAARQCGQTKIGGTMAIGAATNAGGAAKGGRRAAVRRPGEMLAASQQRREQQRREHGVAILAPSCVRETYVAMRSQPHVGESVSSY